jgi:hypothetical protein
MINPTLPTIGPAAIRPCGELEELVREIARLKAREQKLTAEMNRRIHEMRVDYDVVLGSIAVEIDHKLAEALRSIGGRVVQEETPCVEPHLHNNPVRQARKEI